MMKKIVTIAIKIEDVSYNSLSEYKDSAADINKKPGISIWKVISVRYKKSAYDDLLEKEKSKHPGIPPPLLASASKVTH